MESNFLAEHKTKEHDMASTNDYHENTIPSDLSSMNEPVDPKLAHDWQKKNSTDIPQKEATQGTTPLTVSYVVTVRVTTYCESNGWGGAVTDVRVSNCSDEDVNHNNCEDAQYLAGALLRDDLIVAFHKKGSYYNNQRDARIFTDVVKIEDAK